MQTGYSNWLRYRIEHWGHGDWVQHWVQYWVQHWAQHWVQHWVWYRSVRTEVTEECAVLLVSRLEEQMVEHVYRCHRMCVYAHVCVRARTFLFLCA